MEVMLDILCIDRCLSIDEFYDFDDLKKLSIIPSSRMQVVCKTIKFSLNWNQQFLFLLNLNVDKVILQFMHILIIFEPANGKTGAWLNRFGMIIW